MFRSIIIFLAFAVMAIATKNPNYCYEDGCKRTLQDKWGKGKEQCKRDLGCKLTPAAVVKTTTASTKSGVATITVTRVTHVPSAVAAVTSCKSPHVPEYLAHSCEYQVASYISACSCIGATGKTINYPTPTITATVITVIPSSTTTVYV